MSQLLMFDWSPHDLLQKPFYVLGGPLHDCLNGDFVRSRDFFVLLFDEFLFGHLVRCFEFICFFLLTGLMLVEEPAIACLDCHLIIFAPIEEFDLVGSFLLADFADDLGDGRSTLAGHSIMLC